MSWKSTDCSCLFRVDIISIDRSYSETPNIYYLGHIIHYTIQADLRLSMVILVENIKFAKID